MKIFIVDDHSLFREGLRLLLSNVDVISEVHEAANGKILLENILEIKPEIVLMDIDMPEMNGIEATKQVLKILPDTKIIALSMYANENFYSDMIEAGAKGFLVKNSKFDDVKTAILEIYSGRNYFSPEILDAIIRNLNKKEAKEPSTSLSEREVEVLFNICKGFSNQEISEILHLSKRTIDKHRENILLKTMSRNTAGLVIYAIKNNIFEV